jgi:hypothetical protein
MDNIEDLLHRRSDLSTFLVHLTRDFGGELAHSNLLSMMKSQSIQARTVYGIMKRASEQDNDLAQSQRCVCLTETPLEHVWMMCRQMVGRQVQLAPYGLAFSKPWARAVGVNPVWYLDQTPGHNWLTQPLDELREQALGGRAFTLNPDGSTVNLAAHQSQIARIAPLLEQMGPTSEGRKEFWWEREWRKVGDLIYNWRSVVAIFAPEAEHTDVQTDLEDHANQAFPGTRVPPLLDADWGLERMIARLAGVPDNEAGPLPPV